MGGDRHFKPKDLATGGTLSRAAHAADLLQNIHTVQNSVVNAFKSAFNSYVNFAQQYFNRCNLQDRLGAGAKHGTTKEIRSTMFKIVAWDVALLLLSW